MNKIQSIEVVREFERAGLSITRRDRSRSYLVYTKLRTKRIEWCVNYILQQLWNVPAEFKLFKFGGTGLTIELGRYDD